MPLKKIKNSEKGQILLIVVLASVISLTVGLAAISRSVTNNRVSTEEANSQKALSAAEAGVEQQLNKVGAAVGEGETNITLSNNSKVTATGLPVAGNQLPISNGNIVKQDDGADIWLSDYETFNNKRSGKLTIYWSEPSEAKCDNDSNPSPAIEIAVISSANASDITNLSMSRYAVDPCPSRANGFVKTVGTGGSINNPLYKPDTFNKSYEITVSNGIIARVIPIYNNIAKMGVSFNNNPSTVAGLPTQGYIVTSTGTSGDTVRRVKVYKSLPRVPIEFFPYNLFLP